MVLTWGQGGNGKQAWFMLQVFPAKNNTLEPPQTMDVITANLEHEVKLLKTA